MERKTVSVVFVVALGIVLGCAREVEDQEPLRSQATQPSPTRERTKVGIPVLRMASGDMVTVACAKEKLQSGESVSSCDKVNENPNTSAARGFHNNWYDYWGSPYYNNYYYVYDPRWYTPSNFCGGVFGFSCYYSDFGYYNSFYPNYYRGDCSSGCFDASNYDRCVRRQCWSNWWWG